MAPELILGAAPPAPPHALMLPEPKPEAEAERELVLAYLRDGARRLRLQGRLDAASALESHALAIELGKHRLR